MNNPLIVPLVFGSIAIILLLLLAGIHDGQIKQLEAALKAYNIPLDTPTKVVESQP